MNRASPQLRSIARQLIASEAAGEVSAPADIPTPFRALDKLRPHLSMLMGPSGYQALLARALVLATADVPWLKSVQVVADGELQAMAGALAASEATAASDGEVVLLAQLFGLLVAFIGPALTLRLVMQMWPQLSFDDADFGKTASKEKAQ